MATPPPDDQLRATVASSLKLPVCFEMRDRDVLASFSRRPAPFYALAPRNSYLPVLLADAVKESFAAVAPQLLGGFWFEHRDVGLRWHLPVGVLHDLVGDGEVPFRVFVRFADVPRTVVPCRGESDAQTSFFNALKQALHLKTGSAKAFMDLAKADQDDLWNGVVTNHVVDGCRDVVAKLLSGGGSAQARGGGVAMRLLLSNPEKRDAQRLFQAPLPSPTITLREALDLAIAPPGQAAAAPPPPSREWTDVIVQGLRPDLDTPIGELADTLSAYDMYLYVVARVGA